MEPDNKTSVSPERRAALPERSGGSSEGGRVASPKRSEGGKPPPGNITKMNKKSKPRGSASASVRALTKNPPKQSNPPLVESVNEISSLAQFPAESPNPILRVRQDGILLYANPVAQTLFPGFDSKAGKRVPSFWIGLVKEVYANQVSKSVEIQVEEHLWSFLLVPILDKGYVNGYGSDITVRKQAEQELHLLSDTQRQIAQQETLVDIFQLVGKNVQELIGDGGYVGITILDEKEQALRIVGLSGFDSLYENLIRLLKVDPSKLVFPLKESTAADLRMFRSGSLEKFKKSLYHLLLRKVPEQKCEAAERVLKLTGIYTMGFVLHDLHYGMLTILAKRDITPHKGMIENIVNQAALAMHRIKADESLQASEEQLRLVTDNMKDMVVRTDLEGLILYASPSNKIVLGYEPEYLVGKSGYDLIHPEDIDRMTAAVLTALQTRSPDKQEYRYRHADGHYLWLESIGSIIFNESGLPVGAVFSSRDITERKHAAEVLHENEDRLRTIVEGTRALLVSVDTNGHFTYTNDATAAEVGYASPEDLIGKSYLHFVHLEDRQQVLDTFINQANSRQPSDTQEFRIIDTQGEVKWLSFLSTLAFKDGQVVGMSGVAQDITERKRMEEKLEEERILLRTLIDNLPDRIFVMDDQGRKLISNIADWQASGGKTMADVIGKTDLDTYPPELAADYWALDKSVIDTGISIVNREEPGLDSQGKPVWVLSSKVPLHDISGKVVGLVGIGHDITSLKRTEAERQALLEIMQGVASTGSLNELLELIRQSLAKVIYAENFFVVFKNKDSGLFEEVYAVDKYDPPMPPSRLEKSMTSYVFRTGEPLLLTQAKFEELVRRGEAELVGTNPAVWLGAPLKTPSETIGVIVVQNYEDPNCYSERDKEFLASVSSQVALAVERKRSAEALQESENRLSTIVAGTQALLVSVDAEGHFAYANDATAAALGYASPAELIGKPYLHFVHPEDRQQVFDAFIHQANTLQPSSLQEFRVTGTNGKVKWLSFLSNLMVKEGQVVGQTGVAQDITERKQAEEELRLSEERFKLIFENAPDAFYLSDLKGNFVAGNRAAEKITGYDKEQLVGSSFLKLNLLSLDQLPKAVTLLAKNALGKPTGPDEFILKRKDGDKVSVEITTHPVEFDNKTVVLGIARDITDRKRAKEALLESEEKFKTLFNSANDAILTMNHTTFLDCNATTEKIFRCSKEQIVGHSPVDFSPEHQPDGSFSSKSAVEKIESAFAGEPQFFEWLHTRLDGTVFNAEVSLNRVFIAGESILQAIVRDITERKQAQTIQEAVYRIASAAETTRSLDDLYLHIHQIISSVMPAENFYITLYDETNDLLRFPYFKDAADAPFVDGVQPGKGLTAYVLRTGKSLLCTQEMHDELIRRGEVIMLGVPSAIWLGVPLIVEGKTIGAMVLQHYSDPKAYGEREQHILEFVSTQVAIAISRKQADVALRESEIRFQNLARISPVGIFRTDKNGATIYANPMWCQISGLSEDDALGNGWQSAVHPEDKDNLNKSWQESIRLHKASLSEYRFVRPDGTIAWVMGQAVPEMNSEAQVVGYVGTITDITDRKQAEEAIKKQLDELQRWQNATQGRENRILDLKREVNELLGKVSQPPRYSSAESQDLQEK